MFAVCFGYEDQKNLFEKIFDSKEKAEDYLDAHGFFEDENGVWLFNYEFDTDDNYADYATIEEKSLEE